MATLDADVAPGGVLQVLVEGAVDLIPGAAGAEILTVASRGVVRPGAAAGVLGPLLLQMRNEVGVGTCADAVTGASAVHIPDVSTETRWPSFTARAGNLGVRSMLYTPLVVGDQVIGSLGVVSTTPGAFTTESRELVRIFAVHAAAAVAVARRRAEFDDGLARRDIIGQAKGMLMQRFRISADDAFSRLVRASQDSNTKLREICQRLVDSGEFTPHTALASGPNGRSLGHRP